MIAKGRGMAVAFALAPSWAHENRQAPELLAAMPRPAFWSVADRGYASHALRQRLWDRGSRPAIPAKTSNRQPVACPDWIYNNRNIVRRTRIAPRDRLRIHMLYEEYGSFARVWPAPSANPSPGHWADTDTKS